MKTICLLILLMISSVIVFCQEKVVLIREKNTKEVIEDVNYKYSELTGFSDKDGKIKFNVVEGEPLFLSHIRFGNHKFNAEELERLLKDGIIELKSLSKNLQPVTIMQVHSGTNDENRLDISLNNKLMHDAGNLLESVPSISSIRKSGAYGFDPVLRGFKYEQLNLVLDGGLTASAACPNRMDPAASQIPVNMISQVEIMKGPHSLRYGNAFGGTINFKSSLPDFKDKITPLGRLGTSYESNGNIFRTEAVAGVSGQKVDFKLFGSLSEGSNYTDGEGVEVDADFNRLNYGGKIGFKLNDNQTLGLMVANNVAKDVDFPALPMDLREDNTWLFNANHSALFYGKTLSSWNTMVYGTSVSHLMDNFDKIIEPRKTDAETDAETANYGGRTELRFDFNKNFLYGGLDYRYEEASGARTRTMLMGQMAGKVFNDNVWQDALVKRMGVFAEYHYNRPSFYFVFSGRLNYSSSDAKNPDSDFAVVYNNLESEHLLPSFSVGGTKLLAGNASLGIWFGRASRAPGIAEMYINQFPVGLDPYEMLGNPELEPEINNQFDFIFEHKTKSLNFNATVFTSFLRHYISSEIREDISPALSSSPGVRQFVNVDKALMAGFELNWQQVITANLNHELSLAFTYGENKDEEEPLPEIPPLEFRYSLNGHFCNDKLVPEIMFRKSFKQDRVATSYGENETPGFSVVDAKISWLITQRISATGGMHNLFDVAYYEHLARSVRNTDARPIYSPDRSFYFNLTFNFL